MYSRINLFSDRLKTSAKAEAECCHTDREKHPCNRLNKRSDLQYIGRRLQELYLLNTILEITSAEKLLGEEKKSTLKLLV